MNTTTTTKEIKAPSQTFYILTIAVFSLIALAMLAFLVLLLHQWFAGPAPFTTVA